MQRLPSLALYYLCCTEMPGNNNVLVNYSPNCYDVVFLGTLCYIAFHGYESYVKPSAVRMII